MSEPAQQNLEWPGPLDAITLFTESLGATKTFYQNVFDLPILLEDDSSVIFRFGETMLNFLETSGAPELIESATAASPEAGSRFLFTVKVDNVDAKCAELAGTGVALLNGPVDRPWGRRTAAFQDPSGYIWEIAEEI